MKNKNDFIEAIITLLYSWGGDTPSEVIWGLNELINWIEIEYNVVIKYRFSELYSGDGYYIEDYDKVIDEIRNAL